MTLLEDLSRLMREGRLGHAYLVNGDPLEEGRTFAEDLSVQVLGLKSGLPEAQIRHRVETRIHPDVHWVEPRGKLRQIKVEDVSTALKRIYEKSFEGGWKIVGFLGAERMNPSSGNKLLKSLEEPPEQTLILLVTESPEQLLPTLRSRCQLLTLPKPISETSFWEEPLLGLLALGPPRNLRARLDRAAAFRDFFDIAAKQQVDQELGEDTGEVGEDVENARETAARRQLQRHVMATVEEWYRDVLVLKTSGDARSLRFSKFADILQEQADALPMKSIRQIQENIRTAARELNGNLPVQVVLEASIF